MDESHETAGAVAALADFTAIGIEYPVTKIGFFGLCAFDQQQLIKTNAEMTIGEDTNTATVQYPVHNPGLVDSVDNDKIIAQTMHLAETKLHIPCLIDPRRKV